MAKDNSAQVAQLFNEIRDQRDAAIAERARYGDMMTERLGKCENERDAARAEAAALRGALAEMGAYINKYVTLTDTERWLLSTIEAALPSDNSSYNAP